jgi:hypothetical protein
MTKFETNWPLAYERDKAKGDPRVYEFAELWAQKITAETNAKTGAMTPLIINNAGNEAAKTLGRGAIDIYSYKYPISEAQVLYQFWVHGKEFGRCMNIKTKIIAIARNSLEEINSQLAKQGR